MPDVAWGVAFNPAGTKLAACGADRSIRIYDVASGKQERLIEDHADWVMAVAWNHDGTRIASASRDKTSKLFDAATGESLVTYPGHSEQVFGVAFNADSSQVLTTGRDKKVHIWKPADAAKIAEIAGFGQEVYGIVVQAGQIFCCSADKTARQYEAGERKHVRNYEGHADWVYSLAYNDATKRLATGSLRRRDPRVEHGRRRASDQLQGGPWPGGPRAAGGEVRHTILGRQRLSLDASL